MVDKYKSTKYIGNLFGRARKRKTRVTTDRLIQRKLKLVRRKSASMVKIEIENELGISLHVDIRIDSWGTYQNLEKLFF